MKSKKRAKLRAELEELRRQAEELEEQLEASTADESSEPDETRRRLVQGAWIAPVIMAVNVPGSVFAQNMVSPAGKPTRKPSQQPTRKPSQQPTRNPSQKPTQNPTRKPTSKSTM
jgi:hypothetical protein